MALKLSVGLCKKAGLPDYGSVGATCQVEFEVERSLLYGDGAAFQQCVTQAYTACRQAIEAELARHGNGSPNGNGHGHSGNGAGPSAPRPATQSQVRAIHSICRRQGIDITAEVQQRFGVTRPEDLDIRQASELIDAIKPQEAVAGNGR